MTLGPEKTLEIEVLVQYSATLKIRTDHLSDVQALIDTFLTVHPPGVDYFGPGVVSPPTTKRLRPPTVVRRTVLEH